MPTTSVYGFPYQGLTDPPNGATLGQALAEAVEATLQGPLTLGGNLTVPGNLAVTGVGTRLFARKTADTSRASNTTFSADPHLTVALVSGATYIFEVINFLTGSATGTGDFKWRLAFPGSSTIHAGHVGMANNNAVDTGIASADFGAEQNQTVSPTDSTQFLGAIASGPTMHIIKGLVITGSAASLTLEWAQASTNATATVLKAGSHMSAVRVA